MSIAVSLLFGIIAGIVAYRIDAYQTKGGMASAIVFGLLGSLVGGITASIAFRSQFSSVDFFVLVFAFASSLLFLLIHQTAFIKR